MEVCALIFVSAAVLFSTLAVSAQSDNPQTSNPSSDGQPKNSQHPNNHSPNKKAKAAKRDPLADYIQRISGPNGSALASSTPGSLWVDNGRLANLVADYKASRVGDLVTINIAQNLSSTSTGNVATSRAFSASSGITALGGHISTSGVSNLFAPNSQQSLTGKGQSTSTTALTTELTGRVVAVLPSGTLVVEAERKLTMDDQTETVILRGLVRPGDLDATNTVASNSVGDLEVEVKGKGVITESTHPPNPVIKWLLRIFNF
jgi:flagellar L-ring protein FlgH